MANQDRTTAIADSTSPSIAISLFPYQSAPVAYALSTSSLEHHEDESEELRSSIIYQVCKMKGIIDGLSVYANELERVILVLFQDAGYENDANYAAFRKKIEDVKRSKIGILERERAAAQEKARELEDSFESYLQDVMQHALQKDNSGKGNSTGTSGIRVDD
ncbi:hypothetical protein SCHPADRAFT_946212 [Schizopora paradoxa]|uniref:Uncharacterized protein n=1 Tax=Schizopora paradoxa TaxID=27342 RepID=A0A0H2R3C4_9AGAM|nr:hypothetical protein SCHPADRAFT_946212 [Schizopora paradoxa]